MRILLLDNYDSFTWNLHHLLEPHARVDVILNDAITVDEAARYDRIVLSPGPGLPSEAGIMHELLAKLMPTHPILGICLGMQLAVVEFARDVAGMAHAHSTEFVQDTPYPVIGLITEWLDASGKIEKRSEDSDIGGTMRLGAQVCKLAEGSLAREIYGAAEITERHRHRYEVNNTLLAQLEAKGLRVGGRAPGTELCEMVELPADVHPWFVGVQFHPEFTSNPRQGHPLFTSYVKAALASQQAKGK